ncbi:MAG: hypothetical protein EOO38_11515, partial [Cytophagaceae bacterium]
MQDPDNQVSASKLPPVAAETDDEKIIRFRKTTYRFEWTERHEQYCLDNRIYLAHPRKIKGVYRAGTKLSISTRVVVERHATMPKGGFCSVGRHSYSASSLPPNGTEATFWHCCVALNNHTG